MLVEVIRESHERALLSCEQIFVIFSSMKTSLREEEISLLERNAQLDMAMLTFHSSFWKANAGDSLMLTWDAKRP